MSDEKRKDDIVLDTIDVQVVAVNLWGLVVLVKQVENFMLNVCHCHLVFEWGRFLKKKQMLYIMIKYIKYIFLLGDFNVHLLNYYEHNPTKEFLYSITSNSFIPLILQPTRLNSHSNTLTDNIFPKHH